MTSILGLYFYLFSSEKMAFRTRKKTFRVVKLFRLKHICGKGRWEVTHNGNVSIFTNKMTKSTIWESAIFIIGSIQLLLLLCFEFVQMVEKRGGGARWSHRTRARLYRSLSLRRKRVPTHFFPSFLFPYQSQVRH